MNTPVQLERSNSFRERSLVRSSSQTQSQTQLDVSYQFKFFWMIELISIILLAIGSGIMGNENIILFIKYVIISMGGLYGLSTAMNMNLFLGKNDSNTFYVMGNTIIEQYKPYYDYLSPNIEWKLSDEYLWTPFVLTYYIPIVVGSLCSMYIISINTNDLMEVLPLIIAVCVSHSYIIVGFLKMIIAHAIAYVVSCVYVIDENNELSYKKTFMHTLSVISFILTEVLFGYVLSELEMNENYTRGLLTIILHMILNFVFWVEMCRFYKHETGTQRGTFKCFYGNDGNEDYAQYYLLFEFVDFKSERSKQVNWYFGTGVKGKACIAFSYLIFPVLCQIAAYISYELTNDTIVYVSVVNLSHMFFGLAILKSILYGGYKSCEMLIGVCKDNCNTGSNPPLADKVDSAEVHHDQL